MKTAVYISKRFGEIEFTEEEAEYFGDEIIKGNIEHLDNAYKGSVRDPHALLVAAITGGYGWYVKDDSKEKAETQRKRAHEYLKQQRMIKAEVMRERQTKEHQAAAQDFFNLKNINAKRGA